MEKEQEYNLGYDQECIDTDEEDWLGVFGELSGIFPDRATPQRSIRMTSQRVEQEELRSKDDCGGCTGGDDFGEHPVQGNIRGDPIGHPPEKNTRSSTPQDGVVEKDDSGDCPGRSGILETPHAMGVKTILGGWSTVTCKPGPQLNLLVKASRFDSGHSLDDVQDGEGGHTMLNGEGGWSDSALVDGRSQEHPAGGARRSLLEMDGISTVVPSVTTYDNYTPGKQRHIHNLNDNDAAMPGVPEPVISFDDNPPPLLMSVWR